MIRGVIAASIDISTACARDLPSGQRLIDESEGGHAVDDEYLRAAHWRTSIEFLNRNKMRVPSPNPTKRSSQNAIMFACKPVEGMNTWKYRVNFSSNTLCNSFTVFDWLRENSLLRTLAICKLNYCDITSKEKNVRKLVASMLMALDGVVENPQWHFQFRKREAAFSW